MLSAACAGSAALAVADPGQPEPGQANPATVNCVTLKGRHVVETRGDGSEFGVCSFDDNRQCEEWALLRGDCPRGGVTIAGYDSQAARFCVISGGRFDATEGEAADGGRGTCILTDGTTCDADAYLKGSCGRKRAGVAVTFTDPFAYCAAVGTVDAPDDRYTGPEVPDAVLQGLVEEGVVANDAPAERARSAVWRCMDGAVMACLAADDVPCREKADTNPTPSDAAVEFCASIPEGTSIPAAVIGTATVYAWKCRGGRPVIAEEVAKVDAAGFIADSWYLLTAPMPESVWSLGTIGRPRFSRDGRIAAVPIDPDNLQPIRNLIDSGPARSGRVEIYLYEPVGLLPQLLIAGEPADVKRFVTTVREIFLATGAKHTVVISARLTQLSDSDIRSLGLNVFPSSLTYEGSYQFSKGKASTGSLNVFLNQVGGNILVADESLSQGKALVASQVFTPNGLKAEISDVQHEPVFSVDTYGNVQTDYQDLETTIEVVPVVVTFDPEAPERSTVRLDISVKVSTISGEKRTGDVTAPQYSDKSFKTTRVFPSDGRTYLVGSFVSDSDITSRSGVPGLSRVPILKYLFSQKSVTRSRSYALLTLAVTVLPASYSWDRVREEGWNSGTAAGELGPPPKRENARRRDIESDLDSIVGQARQPGEEDDHDGPAP